MELQMQYSYNTYNNMVSNLGVDKEKAMDSRSSRRRSSNSGKIERKIIEKNRRNQMKTLYSKLYSLLPHHSSKEALSLPDQIDEAANYIKSMETRLKEWRERKESLVAMGRKRSHNCIEPAERAAAPCLKPPEIRVEEKGSAVEVALVSGKDSKWMFYEVIRILNEEGADVVNANFSVVGDTTFHIVHADIGANTLSAGVGATNIKEKLNKLDPLSKVSSSSLVNGENYCWESFTPAWADPARIGLHRYINKKKKQVGAWRQQRAATATRTMGLRNPS